MKWLKFSGAIAIKIASGIVMLTLAGIAAVSVWFVASQYQVAAIDQEPLTDYGSTADAVIVEATDSSPAVRATVGYLPERNDDLAYATVHEVHPESDMVQIVPELTGADHELIAQTQVVQTVVTDAPIFGSTVPYAGVALQHPAIFWTLFAVTGVAASVGLIVPAKKYVAAVQPPKEELSSYQIVERLFPSLLISEFTNPLDRKTRGYKPFQP
ncbi:hypothetical protein GCM10009720_09310 [Yaniella flava]|uniref:Capsular polysaccharide biosynthesis protein n=1 Tax=Yaniella flava TaxID=287930 RepID=A0ABP5FRL0_9MICC